MRTLFLFDIDGTLLLSGGAGLRAMDRVTRELFGEEFSWDGIDPSGGLDPLLFEAALERNGVTDGAVLHERFHASYVKTLREELERNATAVRLMPGVPTVLELLREQSEAALGLVTGNYAATAPMKLEAAGIPPGWFEVSACGDEAASREAMVALALERWRSKNGAGFQPRHAIVVGDTPRDVEAAHANGCRAVAVATGRFGVEELTESGADVVLEDLSDPGRVLAFLNGGG